jgi:ATP-dependent RNA helicase RhlE
MQRGVDILIATPGRLLDLANQGHIRFMNLEVLVLDEADRMLDMGFINDIKKIIAKIPQNRQTLFFSATMPDTIADLANSILKDPAKVEVTPPSTTVERIEQEIKFVAKADKLSLLKHVLKNADAESVLVFSRTKHGADRIVAFLEKNSISVAAIHGNKSQGAREKALGGFRSGKVKILVATDIAARGIDVPSISHVINFDIPVDPESYVHRIGRTARAGKTGIAISFCDPSEIEALRAIEKNIKFKIPTDVTHPFHDSSTNVSYDKNQKPTDHESRPQRSRDNRRNDGERRSKTSSFNKKSRHPQNSKSSEHRSTLLGFIGFGKKRSEDKKRSRNSSSEEKTGGFGFGWFKGKKSDSRSGDRRSDSSFDSRSPRSRNSREDSSRFGDSGRREGGKDSRRSGFFGGNSSQEGRGRREGSSRFSDSSRHRSNFKSSTPRN